MAIFIYTVQTITSEMKYEDFCPLISDASQHAFEAPQTRKTRESAQSETANACEVLSIRWYV